jgi:hypothetical protein
VINRLRDWVSSVATLSNRRRSTRLPQRTFLVGGRVRVAVALVSVGMLSAIAPATSNAASPAPRWQVQLVPMPENFPTGTHTTETANDYEVVLTDIGGAPASGPVTISGKLAPGVTTTGAIGGSGNIFTSCEEPDGGREFKCTAAELYAGDSALELPVDVEASAPEVLETEITVEGGGAPTLSRVFTNTHSSATPSFGIREWSVFPTGPAGEDDDVAGGRPAAFNTFFQTPVEDDFFPGSENPYSAQRAGVENVKDMIIDLPPGFVGNPTVAAKCSIQVFLSQPGSPNGCPAGSQVGWFSVGGSAGVYQHQPIYNLVPEYGYPAEFGFYDSGLSHGIVAQATLAHTSQGYAVQFDASELVKVIAGPYYLQVGFFGDPALETGILGSGKPFFTNPSECTGEPLRTTLHLDTWANPAPTVLNANGARDYDKANFSEPQWHNVVSESAPVVGCENLQFNPTFSLTPEETKTDSPSGIGIDLDVPQNEEPEGLATPPLRDATVQLPAGLVVDPSSASGLAGCTESELAPDSTDPGSCPAASEVGTASLRTPLIEHVLEGAVYLGTPGCSPCGDADASSGRLLKLYIEVNDPSTGVVVKVPGTVAADPATGRLTATFKESPQLPFEDLELHINGGSRAPLTTPPTCGEYITDTDLMPWSAPESGPDATPQTAFNLTSGPGGSACASNEGELSDSPSFEAGTTASVAGTYSPFVLSLRREDGSQRFSALNVTLPPGLTGKLAGVSQCSDAALASAAANAGLAEQSTPSCPASSEVGSVTVGAGSGTPFYVHGHAYLAGPYNGAPFSLAIVTPAVAGPFDLGTVVVRSALYIDPVTAQVTVKSDPLPTILAGIPLDIRSIAISISRPEFMLNPTSCDVMSLAGEAVSTTTQAAPLASRFQGGGCKGLAFKPSLAASTAGKASKEDGASLDVKVLYPAGPMGTYANIKSVKVYLPKQLPSRLTTLQKACLAATFEADPASCPSASDVGAATATTPLLSAPLTGPAYLVSHGGEAFPDLEIVLQGEGVTLILDGNTDIKNGITSSTFKAIPDAPVSSFELKLPTGRYSILGTDLPHESHNLCGQKLIMPTEITGQNGVELRESTPIGVEGCAPAIAVVGHKVSGKTATIHVSVPAAGKLVATGKGLSKASKTATGASTLTVKLVLTNGEAAILSKHKGRKLKAKINLTFTPKAGKKLKSSTVVIVG